MNFLVKQRLIDYSLLVIKADWDTYCEKTQSQRPIPMNELSSVQSSMEYCYYHIGIIDYLQEWNVNKQMEMVSKKLIHLQPNLDTSS